MTTKTRIAILGPGGVGGYFGGLLAEKYFNSENVEVIFITRAPTEKVIKEHGLRLITETSERTIFPALVTSNPGSIGPLDYLICATKSYDLEESLIPLKNCITSSTVILPLLNGVDAAERIRTIYPSAEVWDGCVYIVTRLIEPGVVKESGNINVLYFGSNTASAKRLKQFENILKEATIDARLSENIEQTIWEKFLFISPFATLTTYLDIQIAEALSNPDHKETLIALLKELKSVADAKKISLPKDIIDKTLTKMEKVSPGAISSMHSDFRKGGKTELASLTEYVIRQGRMLNLATPIYNKIYSGILAKMLYKK
jgi:2-dehydropantoate 2-reductase